MTAAFRLMPTRRVRNRAAVSLLPPPDRVKEAKRLLARQVRHSLNKRAAFSSRSQPWVTGCRITVNSLFKLEN